MNIQQLVLLVAALAFALFLGLVNSLAQYVPRSRRPTKKPRAGKAVSVAFGECYQAIQRRHIERLRRPGGQPTGIDEAQVLSDAVDELRTRIREALTDPAVGTLQLDVSTNSNVNLTLDIKPPPGGNAPMPVVTVSVRSWIGLLQILIKDLHVGGISINSAPDSVLSADDCDIGACEFANVGSAVTFRNCNISSLRLLRLSVRSLELHDTQISAIVCVKEAGFSHLSISGDCVLCDSSTRRLSSEIQQYRNFRTSAEDKSDELTLRVIHATELRLERPQEPIPFRALSFLYDAFSSYGNKPVRALIVVLITVLLSSLLFYGCDAIALPQDCGASLAPVGWQSEMCDSGLWGQWMRSFVASLGSITNPFSGFNGRAFLVPRGIAGVACIAIESVVNITLLAIAAIGIRRRFKVS